MLKKGIFILVLVFSTAVVKGQCPMCKAALKSSQKEKNGRPVGLGLNKGILFLMTVPYVLVGGVGVAYYYNKKSNKKVK